MLAVRKEFKVLQVQQVQQVQPDQLVHKVYVDLLELTRQLLVQQEV